MNTNTNTEIKRTDHAEIRSLVVIYETINVPINVKSEWNITFNFIYPAGFHFGYLPSHKASPPMWGKSVYSSQRGTRWVLIMTFQIMPRSTVFSETLPYVSHMFVDSNIHGPSGETYILQVTRTNK